MIERLEPLADDATAFREAGIDLCVELSQRMYDEGVGNIHYISMNRHPAVVDVVQRLGVAAHQARSRPRTEGPAPQRRARRSVRGRVAAARANTTPAAASTTTASSSAQLTHDGAFGSGYSATALTSPTSPGVKRPPDGALRDGAVGLADRARGTRS